MLGMSGVLGLIAIRLEDGFDSRFVRVYTEEGLTGTGECGHSTSVVDIINHNFDAMLKGRAGIYTQIRLNHALRSGGN